MKESFAFKNLNITMMNLRINFRYILILSVLQ